MQNIDRFGQQLARHVHDHAPELRRQHRHRSRRNAALGPVVEKSRLPSDSRQSGRDTVWLQESEIVPIVSHRRESQQHANLVAGLLLGDGGVAHLPLRPAGVQRADEMSDAQWPRR